MIATWRCARPSPRCVRSSKRSGASTRRLCPTSPCAGSTCCRPAACTSWCVWPTIPCGCFRPTTIPAAVSWVRPWSVAYGRRYYIREVSRPLCSVGATLLPGAAFALFGARADELAVRHTRLEDLWGPGAVGLLRERLAGACSPAERLDVFESMLAARLPRVDGLHPAVAQALHDLRTSRPVHEAVQRSGYSHRTLIDLFSGAVGLSPKRYARVRRFHTALRYASQDASWADIAASVGYSDQAHFVREFREFAGVTPARYRRAMPRFAHHVPVEGQIPSRPRRWPDATVRSRLCEGGPHGES